MPIALVTGATRGTNFFGAYRLTIALLPLLRASEHPRAQLTQRKQSGPS